MTPKKTRLFYNKLDPSTLLPTDEIITLAQSSGVDFGDGNPNERIRYFIKLGLLPHAVRKSPTSDQRPETREKLANGEWRMANGPIGHLPYWCVARLVEIDRLYESGMSYPQIASKIKSLTYDKGLKTNAQNNTADLNANPLGPKPLTPKPSSQIHKPIVGKMTQFNILSRVGIGAGFDIDKILTKHEKNISKIIDKKLTRETRVNSISAQEIFNQPLAGDTPKFLGPAKGVLVITLTSSILGIGFFSGLKIIDSNLNDKRQAQESINRSLGRVLAATSDEHRLYIDADTEVSGTTLFEENITAPNILYDVLAGTGIAISQGQTPTIALAEDAFVESINDLKGTLTLKGSGKTSISASGSTVTITTDAITTEADTLATVTGRGATTSTASTFSGGLTIGGNLSLSDTNSTINITNAGTLAFKDGTNTLFSLIDQGAFATIRLTDKGSTGDPSTCTAGDVYFNGTDASIKACTATNTWEALDSSAGVAWSSITAPTADLSLSHSTYATTFTSAATTQTFLTLTGTSFTTGELLDLTGTWTPTDGSTNEAIDINITHSPATLADNFQSINLITTDATALGNTVYGLSSTLTLTGNAAKTGYAYYGTVTSTSTTAETAIYGADLLVDHNAAVTTGSKALYGIRAQVTNDGITDASTGTHNIYGGYFAATGNSGDTSNAYGLYSTASGADNNYAGYFSLANTGQVYLDLTLSGGARSVDALTITQANDATNNSTGNLIQLTNSDTGSTAAVLSINQEASGLGIEITNSSHAFGIGFVSAGLTSTAAIAITGISGSDTQLRFQDVTSGLGIHAEIASMTSGAVIGPTGGDSLSGSISAFTGDVIKFAPTRTLSSGSNIDDTGNFLDLSRGNTINLSGGTYTISGDLVTLSSNCTQTLGTCTDTADILSLTQSYASNTGSVINISDSATHASGGSSLTIAASATTGDVISLTGSSLTTGSAIVATGPTSTGVTDHFVKLTSDVGSGAALIYGAPDFSGSGVTGYGINITATDATSSGNTDYGIYSSLALTGNAAKTGYGYYGTVTSTSTTADTLYGLDILTDHNAASASGNKTLYGIRSQVTNNGIGDSAGTHNIYGGYFSATGNTGGTQTAYGLYATASGAGTNYAAYFEGNVRMGSSNTTLTLNSSVSATSNSVIDITSITTITSTGELLNITGNSVSTGNLITMSATGLSSGTGISFTGPSSTGVTGSVLSLTSDVGSAGRLINLAPDFSGAGVTGYGIYLSGTDATTNANTNYGIYASIDKSAVQTGSLTRNYGAYISNTALNSTALSVTGVAVNTSGGGTASYGIYSTASYLTNGSAFGIYSNLTDASGTGGGTLYGLYSVISSSSGTTAYGLYVDAGTGVGTEYAGVFTNGNVGIGDTTPAALLSVGSGDLFQVASTGDITLNETSPSITFTDTTASEDDFILRTSGNAFEIRNSTDSRSDISISGAGAATINGAAAGEGTSTLTITSGDLTITDGDLTLSGGEIAITTDDTTTDAFTLTASTLTSGSAIVATGSTTTGVTDHFLKVTSDVGSAAALIYGAPDFSGSAVTGYGLNITATDSTANANTDYGVYSNLALTGNAAKTGYAYYGTVTSTSTTAETAIYGADLLVDHNAAVTTGSKALYGLRAQVTNDGITDASTGTHNLYGLYGAATGNTGDTQNVIGVFGTASGGDNNYPFYAGVAFPNDGSTSALCWDNVGASAIVDCTTPLSDYAEIYSVENSVEYGEIVAVGNNLAETKHVLTDKSGNTQQTSTVNISKLAKSHKSYQENILGITSQNWANFSSIGEGSVSEADNPMPVALNGRVPVKVSTENGPIAAGDFITSSSTPGVGMKATNSGRVIGVALEAFSPQSTDYSNVQTVDSSQKSVDNFASGKIIVFINPTFYLGEALAANGSFPIQSTDYGLQTTDSLASGQVNSDGTLSNIGEPSTTDNDNQILTADDIRRLIEEEVARQLASNPIPYRASDSDTGSETLSETDVSAQTDQMLDELNALLRTTNYQLPTLQVTGNANLAQTQVAGTFSVDGTLVIDYGKQINVLGDTLYLQNDSLAGACQLSTVNCQLLDIGAGALTFDRRGNLKILGTLTAQKIETGELALADAGDSPTVGSSKLTAGTTTVSIATSALKPGAKVLVTPTTPTGGKSLYVAQKTDFEGFRVAVEDGPAPSEIKFDWLIVNTTQISQAN